MTDRGRGGERQKDRQTASRRRGEGGGGGGGMLVAEGLKQFKSFFLSCHGPSAAVGPPAVLSHRGKEDKQHTDTHKEEDK